MPRAWSKLRAESPEAYRAFLAYRDMGPARTLDAVGRALHPGRGDRRRGRTGCIDRWARRFEWIRRSEAWDTHKLAVEVRRHQREDLAMRLREINRRFRERTRLALEVELSSLEERAHQNAIRAARRGFRRFGVEI